MRSPVKEIWNGDYKCININCERDIPSNIVEKQYTHPKNRVCFSCKNRGVIRWKCIGCDNILNNNSKTVGVFYCNSKCRIHNNYARTYVQKVRPIILPSIRGCQYCTKRLTHTRKLPFCDKKCHSKHRMLEKHRMIYKRDIVKRSNARMVVKNPKYNKEKREKNREYTKNYNKNYYNRKKLERELSNK